MGKIKNTRRVIREVPEEKKRFFWVLLVFVLIIGIWIGVQGANQGVLTLATSAQGLTNQDGNIKVRVRALDALKINENLYSVDQTAVVKDGQLKLRWQIPETAKKRAAYIEICALDKKGAPSKSVKSNCINAEGDLAYNKVSCPYYVPANSTGFSGQLNGWNKLDDSQKVGCGTGRGFSTVSAMKTLATVQSPALNIDGGGILVADKGKITARNIDELVRDALNDQIDSYSNGSVTYLTTNVPTPGPKGDDGADGLSGADGADGVDGAAGIATVSGGGLVLTGSNLSLDDSCIGGQILQWDGANWVCASVAGTDSQTLSLAANVLAISGGNSVNLSGYLDNTDSQALSWVSGTRTLSLTGGGSVVISDSDTTYSAGNGLSLGGTTFSINSPTCAGTTKLTWNGTAFSCAADVDTDTNTTNFNISANSGASQNIAAGNTVNFNNGTGTTASRSGNDISFGLNNTAVTSGTYAPSNNANGSMALPQFTVDAQGRLTSASTTNVTLTGIANSQLANSAITVNTAGALAGGGSVSLGGSLNLSLDLSDAGDSATATTSSGSGLEVSGSEIGLLRGCSSNQLLKWNSGSLRWECATDTDTDTNSGGTVTSITAGTGLSGGAITTSGTINIANTGVTAASYGSSTSIPVITVNAQGQITAASSSAIPTATTSTTGLLTDTDWDTFNGKENVLTFNGNGLFSRSGDTVTGLACSAGQIPKWTAGTFACGADDNSGSTYTAGNGLSLSVNSFSINSPTCAGTDKLTWNGTAFTCASDVDTDTDTTYSAGTGLGLSGTTFNLANTAVTGGTYSPSDNTNGSLALPQFTVDAQGRLTAASTTNVTLTGIANSQLTNSAITVNTAGGLTGGSSVSLGGSINLSLDLSDAGDTATATTNSGSGLEVSGGEIGLIRGCSSNQLLKWNSSSLRWECASDTDTDTNSGGTVTSITAGTGLSGGTITASGTIDIAASGVTAATYGSSTSIPVITVNAQGQITAASSSAIPTATTSTTGLLTDTDWDTFNGKENVLTFNGNGLFSRSGDTITGLACSAGEIPKWTAGTFACGSDAGGSSYSAGNGLSLGGSTFSINSPTCAGTDKLQWTGTAFICSADVDTDTGVTSVGTIDSQTKSANGAVISGTSLVLQTADGSSPGLVSTTTQTFAGDKTFSGSVNANGDVTLGNAAADGITITGEIRGASPLAFEGATNDGVYTTFAITDPTSARTITFPDASGTVCLQGSASCGFISVTLNDGQILVGNGSNVATAVTPSGDVTISNSGVTTIGANSVALGTDTTGNYVASNTAGNGISVSGSAGEGWSPTISINAPTCAGTDKLTWNGSAFSCASDVDTDTDTTNFNVVAQGTVGSQNITSGDTVTFNNGTGTTATRSGSTVTYGLNNTAVSAGSYAPSDNANGSLALPQFTVDAQGRLTAASTTNVTLTGIANSQLTNSAITVNTAGGLTGGSSVSLGGSINLSLDLSDAGDANTATTSSGSGLEVSSGEIGLLRGCNTGQLLKYDSTTSLWACAADTDTNSGGTVTSITAGTGLSGGTITTSGTIDIANTGVTAATYGSSTSIPVIAVNAQGQITSASSSAIPTANTSTTGLLTDTDWDTFNGKENVLTFNGNGLFSRSGNTVTGLACSTGEIPKWSGGTFACGTDIDTDTDTTYSAGNGLSLGGTTFAINSPTCAGTDKLTWSGTAFSCASDVDTDTGVTSIGTIDSQAKSANGAVISGTSLVLQTADGSNPGLVSTGTQTFAGAKTFSGSVNANGDVTLGDGAADGITITGEIRGASPLAFEGATNDGVYTTFAITDPTLARTVTFPDRSGTVSLSGDTFTGDVTGTLNASGATALTIAANSVALGTDTTGNYVADVSAGTGLSVSGTPGEGWTPTVSLANTAVSAGTYAPADNANGSIAVPQFTVDAQGRLTAASTANITPTGIANAQLANSSLTVTAGAGLANGGSVSLGGSVALDIGAGNGITVNANDITIDLTAATDALSANTSSSSGLEVLGTGLTLLQGCSNSQLLKWNETTDVWECAADTDTDTGVTTIGTIDSQIKSANGAVISGTSLVLQTADASNPGLVSTGTQTFAGNKTFSGNTILSGSLNANGDVTLGDAATDGITFTGEIRGASPLAFEGSTNDGVYTTFAITDPTGARTVTFADRSGTVSLSGDTFTGDVTGTLNSTGATALTIAANSVALGTDTTGDYVSNVTAGGGLTGSATGEGSTPTLAIVSSNGGIVVNADDIALTIAASANALSATTSSGSGLEILASGVTLLQGCSDTQILAWNETTDVWECAANTDTGVTSIGTIDSQAKSANGAVISGSVIYLQTADATNVGLVSTGTQTFAGNKTFNGNVIADANLTVNGDVVLGNAASDAITFTGEVRGASPLAFEGATNDGVYTTFAITDPTLARTITFPDRSGTVSLSGDTFTGDVTGTLNASGATTLTIASNSVALGTDTTGDYVTNVTAGGGLTGSATGEGSTPTLAIVSSNGGIVVNADDIALTVATSANALSATTSSGSGLEILASGLTLLQGCSDGQLLKWNETTDVWECSADTDTGVTTIGTIDSQAKVANGAVISGNTLYLQTADATNVGLVSTGTQTFAGDKTFSGNVIASGNLTANGDVTLGNAATDGLTFTGEIRGASPLAFEGATNDGVYTTFAITDPTLARTITFPDASGIVCLQGSASCAFISTTLADGQILIGNGSNVATAVTPSGDVTISNTGATTIGANSVALSTDTTGNYVAGNTAGNGISVSGSAGEGWSPAIAINSPTCVGTDKLTWSGSAFSCAADVDTDTGVTSVGTIDSQTKSANGAVISGTSLVLQTADGSSPGLVSTTTQTFAGDKTFSGSVNANGDVTLGDAAADGITITGEIRGASPLAFEGSTNDGVYTTFAITDPTLARTITFPDRSGTVSLSGDTFTGDVTGTLNSTGATALTIAANSVALGTDTTGDYVTNITAGGGLTGSATGEGSTPTLAIVSSNGGIAVNADDIALTIAASADALSATTSSGSGLEVLSTGLTLLQGCSDGQLLKWNETTDVWGCSADIDTDTGVTTIGTLDSLTKSANGAVISGNTLVLQTADASMPGLVSTGTQTFAGDKTFTGLVTANGNFTLQTGDTFTMNGDAFTDLTGSGLAISSGALIVDDTSATGFFRNGGNTFGAAGTLGTNDANVLNIETNGTNRFQFSSSASTLTGQGATTLTSTGTLALSSAAASDLNITSGNDANITANSTTVLSQNDSATAFQVQTSLASPLFNVDASTASTTVYSPSDSATAFQVQNSTAGLLFNVDAATSSTTIASPTNSTTALQVLNGSGDQLMNIDTTNIVNNLIANPSFEVNDTGWAYNPGYVDTTQAYVGKSSLRVDAANTGDGSYYDVALASDTSYTLSFYAKAGSENDEGFASMYAGYYDGTSDVDCLTSQTVSTSGWTRYTCTFTTGTTSGTPNIYIRQNDSTARAFYVDGVQLLENTLPSSIITGTNSTFESGVGSWSGYSGSGPTQSSAQAHMGTYSGRMITTGGGGENGVSLSVSGLVSASTTYTIKAYIKADASSTQSTYQLGHTLDNGQVTTSRNGCNVVTPTSSVWKVLTCTFTTDSSLRASPYITLTQTNNLTTATTTYIDSVSMYAGTDTYGTDQGFTMGRISLNGAIESPTLFQNASNSTTAFQIQGANSSNALLVADTLNNRIAIGKDTAAYTLDVEGIINASSSVITPSLTSLAGTALTIDSGTTGALSIGTGSNAKAIIIGNGTGATSAEVNCGTGVCKFGANATVHTTTLGSLTGASSTVVQAGTGGLTLGSSGVANTIQIGNTTGAVSQTINIGNNATASSTSNVNIGSTVAGTTAIAGPTTITGRTSGSSSTLVVNNSTSTGAIFTAQDNGTAVLTIANNGGATFKTATNTASAFKTTNSNNDVLLNVGTAQTIPDLTNMLNNSSFESGSTGWSSKSGGIIGSGSGGGSVTGISYMSVSMDAVGEGAYYSVTLSPNTDYTFSVYAKTSWGATDDLIIGHQDLFGSDIDDCVLSGDTIDADWHRISCTFTTGGTISSSSVYIKQGDGTARTIDYDAAQLQAQGALGAYNMGEVYFNAPINQNLIITGNVYAGSNDLTFQVQDVSGGLQFGVSVAGQVTVANGLAVNGGDLTSTATTFNFLQSNVTELNIGDAVGSSGINLAGGSGSTGCTIQGVVGSLTCSGNITSTATSGIQGWWTRSGTTLQPINSGDNITTSGNISTTSTGSITSAGGLQVDGNTILGDAATDTIMAKGSMIANATATGTTDTTSGTGTNTTTVTIVGTAFANGDVILIDNAGQDYYTRVTAGGGTSSLTVSPAVTFETGRTVTKYNIQNIGATNSDYTTQANRFFQGYFLGGVVTGAGSTTLSDGRLASTVGLNFDAPNYTFTNTSDSTTAFKVNKANGENLVKFDTATTENLLSNGNFEANITGWATYGGSTVTQTGSQYHLGSGSMSVATTAANDGAKFNYALASQTNYTMTFYVKNSLLTSAVSTINIGRSEDGSTDSNCATAQTINGAGFSKLTCTFTTGNVTGTDYIYIKQTDAVARTLYVDSVQLQSSTNIASNPDVEVDTSGWGYYGAPTLSQTGSQFYTGAGSLQVDTSLAASSEGPALNTFTAQPNTTYTFSAMVMLDAGTGSNKTISVLKNLDSVDSGAGTSCTSASLTPGTWTNMTCTFTTNSVTTLNPFISINVTDDGVTPITFYVDNASLAVTKWNSNDIGRISLNGSIDSPLTIRGAQDSTSALQVQQQNGKNVLTVDTLNGRVGIGTDAPTKTLQVDGKALIKATSTDTDTFQVLGTTTSNNVAFNVGAATKVVTVGSSTNTSNASFTTYGIATFTPKSNSTSAFRVQNAAGTNMLQVDSTGQIVRFGAGVGTFSHDIDGQTTDIWADGTFTISTSSGNQLYFDPTNFSVYGASTSMVLDDVGGSFQVGDGVGQILLSGGKLGVGVSPGLTYTLDVDGDANLSSGSVYRIGGVAGATTTCSGGQVLLNPVLLGGLTTGGSCSSGGAVTSIGTIDSQTKSANGAVISGNTLVLQTADGSSPGLVSATTQTFGGDKTFNGSVTSNTSVLSALFDQTTAAALDIGTTNATAINLNQNTSIASNKTLTANGRVTFKDASNSPNAFQIQNSSGDALFNAGSSVLYSPTSDNLIVNSNFENTTTGWQNKNGGSIGGGGTNGAYLGQWWLTNNNTGVDDGGSYSVTLSPSTTYTFSAYVKLPSGSMSTLVLGHQDQSGTDIDCAASPSFADTDGWVRVSCTFTTGGTISSSNVYIKQSDGTTRTIYVDAAMLQQSGGLNAYTMGDVFFSAPINKNLLVVGGYSGGKAFQVQNLSGTALFALDTATNQITADLGMSFYAPSYAFKNTADSAYAFQVQKSNGTSIFNVNTNNDRIEFTSYNTSGGLAQSSVADGASAKAFEFNTTSNYTTSGARLAVFSNWGVEKAYIDKDGNIETTGGIQTDGSSILGDATTDTVTSNGSIIANSSATGTTATTSGTGTNTTTVTLSGSAFADGDVILIDNAGQDYYTRITAGGGTASLTVSPAVTFETGRTVTKYNIQNIGATDSDYTTQANRFFQGYFLGGVVTGSGSTTLSDGLVSSTGGTLNFKGGGADSATAVGLAFDTPAYSTSGAKLVSFANNGTEKFSVDKDGNVNIASGAVYKVNGTSGLAVTCSGGQFLQDQVVVGGLTTGGTCAAGGSGVTTVGAFSGSSIANGASISGSTITFGPADVTNPGMVTTGTQTFAGAKTFNGATTLAGTPTVTNGLVMSGVADGGSAIGFNFNTPSYTTAGANLLVAANNGVGKFAVDKDGNVTIDASAVYKVGAFSGITGGCTSGQFVSDINAVGGLFISGTCLNAVTTIGSIGGSIANGGSISGNTLTFGTADATNPGMVSTGTQTFGGDKTFSSSATTGTAFAINAASLTSGTAFEVTGPSAGKLLRVKNDNGQGFNQAQVIIGEGDANNPESLARDSLYVFGRINTSWNQLWTDCLTSEGTKTAATTATGVYGAAYSGSATTGRLAQGTTSGVSGACRFTFATPAANATTYFGSGGASTTQRSLNAVFEARVLSDSNTDHRNLVGFTDMAASTAITADTNNSANEAFFRKTAAGTSWEAVTRTASGTEQVTTAVGATNAWHRMRVELDDTNAAVRFYVDGTLVATHTTAAPTAQMGFTVANNVTSTTSRTLDVDYMRVWSDDPPESVAPGSIAEGEGLDTTDQTETAQEVDQAPVEDSSNDALLARIKDLETDVEDLNQYKDVLTTETLGDASTNKAVFIADVEFRKQVEFSADALFKANVNVDGTLNANGRVVVSNNTGTVTVQPGQTEVQMLFAKPLGSKPNVFISTEDPNIKVAAKNRSATGFTIILNEPLTEPLEVQWFAVEK